MDGLDRDHKVMGSARRKARSSLSVIFSSSANATHTAWSALRNTPPTAAIKSWSNSAGAGDGSGRIRGPSEAVLDRLHKSPAGNEGAVGGDVII